MVRRFSNSVIVHHRNGTCLMFRTANEAQLRVSVIQGEVTQEGHTLRRFHTLRLERGSSTIFALTWTDIHPIDDDSPLRGLTAADVNHTLAAVVITFAQGVHARHTYLPDDIVFNHRFVDMLDRDEEVMMTIHHERLHLTEALPRDTIAEALFGSQDPS